jgi:hypothetical protein
VYGLRLALKMNDYLLLSRSVALHSPGAMGAKLRDL